MKPLYMLLLFYASVKENTLLIADAIKTVNALSKGEYRRLGYGEHMCAIGFTSEQPYAAIDADLKSIRGDKLHALVIEVTGIVGGAMYEEAWKWLARYRGPRKK